MKLRIVATALLIGIFSVSAISSASAHPWGWGHRGGWYGPHVGVRVGIPAPPIVVGGGYGPGYYDGGYAYSAPACYEPTYYGGPRYYRGYAQGGYYRGGGYDHEGGYGHEGGRGREGGHGHEGGYEHGGGYGHGGGRGGYRR